MTITEALSEINLVKKKLKDKRTAIEGMLVGAEHVPDAYAAEGGSAQHILRETQSIFDLQARLIALRQGISRANLETMITLTEGSETQTRSLHDWLIWKREIVKEQMAHTSNVTSTVKRHMDSVAKQPQIYKDNEEKIHLVKHVVFIDYPAWVRSHAVTAAFLERLDGQLSLKNATVEVKL